MNHRQQWKIFCLIIFFSSQSQNWFSVQPLIMFYSEKSLVLNVSVEMHIKQNISLNNFRIYIQYHQNNKINCTYSRWNTSRTRCLSDNIQWSRCLLSIWTLMTLRHRGHRPRRGHGLLNQYRSCWFFEISICLYVYELGNE